MPWHKIPSESIRSKKQVEALIKGVHAKEKEASVALWSILDSNSSDVKDFTRAILLRTLPDFVSSNAISYHHALVRLVSPVNFHLCAESVLSTLIQFVKSSDECEKSAVKSLISLAKHADFWWMMASRGWEQELEPLYRFACFELNSAHTVDDGGKERVWLPDSIFNILLESLLETPQTSEWKFNQLIRLMTNRYPADRCNSMPALAYSFQIVLKHLRKPETQSKQYLGLFCILQILSLCLMADPTKDAVLKLIEIVGDLQLACNFTASFLQTQNAAVHLSLVGVSCLLMETGGLIFISTRHLSYLLDWIELCCLTDGIRWRDAHLQLTACIPFIHLSNLDTNVDSSRMNKLFMLLQQNVFAVGVTAKQPTNLSDPNMKFSLPVCSVPKTPTLLSPPPKLSTIDRTTIHGDDMVEMCGQTIGCAFYFIFAHVETALSRAPYLSLDSSDVCGSSLIHFLTITACAISKPSIATLDAAVGCFYNNHDPMVVLSVLFYLLSQPVADPKVHHHILLHLLPTLLSRHHRRHPLIQLRIATLIEKLFRESVDPPSILAAVLVRSMLRMWQCQSSMWPSFFRMVILWLDVARHKGVSGGRVQWIAAGNELEFSILSSLLEVSESSAPDRVHQLVPFISSVLALGSNSTLRCIFVMRILNSCIQNDATHAHADTKMRRILPLTFVCLSECELASMLELQLTLKSAAAQSRDAVCGFDLAMAELCEFYGLLAVTFDENSETQQKLVFKILTKEVLPLTGLLPVKAKTFAPSPHSHHQSSSVRLLALESLSRFPFSCWRALLLAPPSDLIDFLFEQCRATVETVALPNSVEVDNYLAASQILHHWISSEIETMRKSVFIGTSASVGGTMPTLSTTAPGFQVKMRQALESYARDSPLLSFLGITREADLVRVSVVTWMRLLDSFNFNNRKLGGTQSISAGRGDTTPSQMIAASPPWMRGVLAVCNLRFSVFFVGAVWRDMVPTSKSSLDAIRSVFKRLYRSAIADISIHQLPCAVWLGLVQAWTLFFLDYVPILVSCSLALNLPLEEMEASAAKVNLILESEFSGMMLELATSTLLSSTRANMLFATTGFIFCLFQCNRADSALEFAKRLLSHVMTQMRMKRRDGDESQLAMFLILRPLLSLFSLYEDEGAIVSGCLAEVVSMLFPQQQTSSPSSARAFSPPLHSGHVAFLSGVLVGSYGFELKLPSLDNRDVCDWLQNLIQTLAPASTDFAHLSQPHFALGAAIGISSLTASRDPPKLDAASSLAKLHDACLLVDSHHRLFTCSAWVLLNSCAVVSAARLKPFFDLHFGGSAKTGATEAAQPTSASLINLFNSRTVLKCHFMYALCCDHQIPLHRLIAEFDDLSVAVLSATAVRGSNGRNSTALNHEESVVAMASLLGYNLVSSTFECKLAVVAAASGKHAPLLIARFALFLDYLTKVSQLTGSSTTTTKLAIHLHSLISTSFLPSNSHSLEIFFFSLSRLAMLPNASSATIDSGEVEALKRIFRILWPPAASDLELRDFHRLGPGESFLRPLFDRLTLPASSHHLQHHRLVLRSIVDALAECKSLPVVSWSEPIRRIVDLALGTGAGVEDCELWRSLMKFVTRHALSSASVENGLVVVVVESGVRLCGEWDFTDFTFQFKVEFSLLLLLLRKTLRAAIRASMAAESTNVVRVNNALSHLLDRFLPTITPPFHAPDLAENCNNSLSSHALVSADSYRRCQLYLLIALIRGGVVEGGVVTKIKSFLASPQHQHHHKNLMLPLHSVALAAHCIYFLIQSQQRITAPSQLHHMLLPFLSWDESGEVMAAVKFSSLCCLAAIQRNSVLLKNLLSTQLFLHLQQDADQQTFAVSIWLCALFHLVTADTDGVSFASHISPSHSDISPTHPATHAALTQNNYAPTATTPTTAPMPIKPFFDWIVLICDAFLYHCLALNTVDVAVEKTFAHLIFAVTSFFLRPSVDSPVVSASLSATLDPLLPQLSWLKRFHWLDVPMDKQLLWLARALPALMHNDFSNPLDTRDKNAWTGHQAILKRIIHLLESEKRSSWRFSPLLRLTLQRWCANSRHYADAYVMASVDFDSHRWAALFANP